MQQATLERWAGEEISEVLGSFPAALRKTARQCAVSLEDCPGREPADEELEGDELGLFEGASLMEMADADFDSLPRVRLFLGNLWEWVEEDEEAFREEVRITYLHEIGHYLGWDEDEVEARGLG